MAKIKSYTNLSQSKALSKILSDKSADMYWWYNGQKYYVETIEHNDFQKRDIPCWSLAALLSVIPQANLDSIKQYDKRYWICYAYFTSDWHSSVWCNNPVDACVAMIIKMHELKKK